jgi:hypothetical protein
MGNLMPSNAFKHFFEVEFLNWDDGETAEKEKMHLVGGTERSKRLLRTILSHVENQTIDVFKKSQ